jgi:hypothetical protein
MDISSPVVNCSAFQEIISYQNTFFNNTVFNFYTGSRRQAPAAGRNKYLGNIWDGIGQFVFRHADPAKTPAEGNARDAGPAKEHFALESNAYAGNVFYDAAEMGVLEPSGRWLRAYDDFKAALQKNKCMVGELGQASQTSPLRNPAKGDFRPTDNSAALEKGAKVFVPWALSGVVGEWNFYHTGDDPTRIIDEHWYMTDYHVSRDTYHERPMYPLKGVNLDATDYVPGPLEDWIPGALNFSAVKKQYAVLSNAEMMKAFSFQDFKKSRHEGAKPEPCTVEGEALKNPQIYVDGGKDASGHGVDGNASLANDGDVHVGGTPDGRYFGGAIDFLRIVQGTLKDAATTIEELYAWEFDGPFLRDFAGRKPTGARRAAGAVEKQDQ